TESAEVVIVHHVRYVPFIVCVPIALLIEGTRVEVSDGEGDVGVGHGFFSLSLVRLRAALFRYQYNHRAPISKRSLALCWCYFGPILYGLPRNRDALIARHVRAQPRRYGDGSLHGSQGVCCFPTDGHQPQKRQSLVAWPYTDHRYQGSVLYSTRHTRPHEVAGESCHGR